MKVQLPLCLMLLLAVLFAEAQEGTNSPTASRSRQAAVLTADSAIDLTPYTNYLIDAEDKLTPSAIFNLPISQFFTYNSPTSPENFGHSTAVYWLRFTVKNSSDQVKDSILELATAHANYVAFYIPENNQSITQVIPIETGVDFDFYSRPIESNFFALELSFEPQEEKTIFIKAHSRILSFFPVTIYTGNSYEWSVLLRQILSGLFIGIIIGLIIYNTSLFLITKMPVYFYFNLTAFFTGIVLASRPNYLNRFWPDSPFINSAVYFGGQMLWAAALVLFSMSYLNTKKYSPTLHKFMLFFTLYTIFFTVLVVMGISQEIFQNFFVLPSFIFGSLLTVAGIKRYISGYKPAIYLLFGITMPMITGGTKVLIFMGLIINSSALELLLGNIDCVQLVILSVGMAAMAKTLTDEKLASEKQALSAATLSETKSQFLHKMSFQIRTPMNSVIGGTELLKNTELDTEQKHYVDIISNSGRSLLAIVDDVINFTRYNNKNDEKNNEKLIEIQLEPCSLTQAIMDSTSIFELNAQHQNIQLKVEIQKHIPDKILADPKRLRQVLLNLLSNAFKFTESGSITIALFYLGEYKDLHEFKVTITDTGIGISEKNQQKLFQSYSQVNPQQGKQYEGTGLGLNISKQIIQQMGGEIGVRSTEGQGSTFWFTLKFAKASAIKTVSNANVEMKNIADPSNSSRAKALLVEDNSLSQQVGKAMLKQIGINSLLAMDGAEAVSIFKSQHEEIDFVLMDCKLPICDGFDATKQIRHFELTNNLPITPIIAVTARVFDDERNACFDAGMNGYIAKPVTLDALIEQIDNCKVMPKGKRNAAVGSNGLGRVE